MSPRELHRQWLPLFMLAVMAVLTTTAAVASLGYVAAGLPLAAAVALGAIVAPPDAAASGAVLDAVGLPRQAQFLLEGESLLNDASSLLLYGFAVSLAVPEQAESGSFGLLVAVPGGILVGLAAAWITVGRLALDALHRSGRSWAPKPVSWPVAVAMGWAGMRGVVTLAAAFSLPDAMPQSWLITLSAYAVVFGTLVLQGVTIGPLIRCMRMTEDAAAKGELAELRRTLVDRALATIATREGEEAASMRIRPRQIAEVAADSADPQDVSRLDRLELRALRDQRTFLDGLRTKGDVAEDACRRMLEELDWAELHLRSFKDNSLA